MKFDAVIVGARCAGAATAMLLARAGARVLLLDKGAYATDTLSTHAMMRGGVLQLHRWGLLWRVIAAGTPPVRSTTFSYSEQDVTVPIEERFGVSSLYAPRRVLLDRILVDAAADSGAQVEHGVRVDDVIADDSGRVRGVRALWGGARREVEADLVIGADGLYSTVARLVGARTLVQGRHAAGVLYSYWRGLPVEGYYWKFARHASIGVIPTNDGAACVFAAVPAAGFRADVGGSPDLAYRRLIRGVSPSVDALLANGEQVDGVRGFGGHPGFVRESSGLGWALVGDAGYFKDPATAHGITDALRDAELLGRAVLQGTAAALTGYERTRHDLSARLFELTDRIASFVWTDDAQLQLLHRGLSTEMSREVRALAALAPMPSLMPAAAPLAV
jgi:menaquinone-9 beta-reductase